MTLQDEVAVGRFERRWKRKGSVLCDLYVKAKVEGGSAGDRFEYPATPTVSGIHLIYQPVGQNSQTVIGGKVHLASHQLEMNKTTATTAITPEDQIRVPANGLVFEQPVIIKSIEQFTVIANATLVQQGYRQ